MASGIANKKFLEEKVKPVIEKELPAIAVSVLNLTDMVKQLVLRVVDLETKAEKKAGWVHENPAKIKPAKTVETKPAKKAKPKKRSKKAE